MSKHKHKKHNKQQLEKIAKAQAKNEFLRRLKKVLTVIGCEAVFNLLSQRTIDLMFEHRWPSVKVVGAEDNTFHTDDLKWFKKALVHYLKTKMMDLGMSGPEIDVYTFSTVGMTLRIFTQVIIDKDLVKHPEYQEVFKRFEQAKKLQIDRMIDDLWDITEYICFLISDLRTRIYWTINTSEMNDERLSAGSVVKIHSLAPEKKNFIIKRELHAAVRVGWAIHSKPHWVSIKPESIGLRAVGESNLIDVYIQEHALKRIIERNNCVYIQYLWMALNGCLYDLKYHYHPDNGKYMIDFMVWGIKTGYLLAEMVDAKLVIQTFLFITNDGTPEGKKLHANTGLSKADKEYLMVDKLSTFISPDVHCNQKIRTIFREAGCDSIFRLKAECDKRKIMLKKPASASLIEDYLMLNEEKTMDHNWEDEAGSLNE
jgi:hypothetical protein